MTNPDELERLARKCDEGDPWYTSVDLITQSYGSLLPQDRAFIAAANPATVLALLSANREMRAAVEFYANPETYHAICILADRPAGEFADDFSDDHGHPDYDRPVPGKRARSSLTTQRGDGE